MTDMNKENVNKINSEELTKVAGGNAGQDYVHDLNNFEYHTVCNLPSGTCLEMQRTTRGSFMGVMYYNGNSIFVHRTFMENGYFLAYRDGLYGFVDAKYVR